MKIYRKAVFFLFKSFSVAVFLRRNSRFDAILRGLYAKNATKRAAAKRFAGKFDV